MATVLLVRHGETTWNRRGRIQGWAPTRLTDRGERQAAAVGEALTAHDPDRLVCSDLERATATAEAVAAATGLEPAPDRAWRERDYGFLQGLPSDEAFERFPRLSVYEPDGEYDETPAGGESVREFARRARRAWTTLTEGLAPEETAAVVTHSGVLSVVVAHLRDESLGAAFRAEGHDNCAVTEVTVRDVGTTVVREAWTEHLDGVSRD